MGNLRTYSGITTKIRAMQAKLLTEADYENIANLKTVPEVIEYLKEKPAYTKYINRMDTSLYHRGDVEKVLTQSFYDDYTRIFRFVGMEQKKFLKAYWKRYEIDLINYCLRIVFNHYDVPFDIDYKKEIFDKYSQLSVSKLVLSKNVEELIDNLKGTEYYSPLQTLRESGAATLYDYDLTLELYYFSVMWKEEKRLLKGKERDIFIKDYGMRIDLTNIRWIYRAKKYYNMLPPDIYMMTCRRMGALPENTYAVEDSYNGIRSAHSACLRPIMVPDLMPATEEMRNLSVAVFEDLFQVKEYFETILG